MYTPKKENKQKSYFPTAILLKMYKKVSFHTSSIHIYLQNLLNLFTKYFQVGIFYGKYLSAIEHHVYK